LSQLYIGLMIFEYLLELIFKIVIPYKLGFSIIADRYVYNTIINDIAIDMELSPTDTINLLGKFWFLIPRPDITFLVKVPEHVAIKRKNDIPSLSYLKIRNNYYDELILSEQFVVLDGTLKISELEEKCFMR
jgi:thymidylate kinase